MPFLSRYVKEVLFFNELCEWGNFFCQNLNGTLNCKGLDLGEQPSCMKLVDVAVLTHKPLIIHVGLGLKLSFSLSLLNTAPLDYAIQEFSLVSHHCI